jgi:hypothetical protein
MSLLDDVSIIYVQKMDTIYGRPYVFGILPTNVKRRVSMSLLCVNFDAKRNPLLLYIFLYNPHLLFYLSLWHPSSFLGHPMTTCCFTLIFPKKEFSLHPCFRSPHIFDILAAPCMDIVFFGSIFPHIEKNKKQLSHKHAPTWMHGHSKSLILIIICLCSCFLHPHLRGWKISTCKHLRI